MPKIIFKCNYIKANKSGVAARKNLVKYIATRDGVVVSGVNKNKASSKSQINLIKELLNEFTDSKDLFEYKDYIENPTMKNASELITRIIEDNYNKIGVQFLHKNAKHILLIFLLHDILY